MADLGLSLVRVGEFAWSLIEPEPGQIELAWLEDSIGVLAEHGLSAMLGTPTATPPKWLIDQHPDILAYDREGRVRGFGSRRHYCFSSETYRAEAARITQVLADRFGSHSAVTHWQTDNEFGCHDTTRSYSPSARDAFRQWLSARYSSIEALNEAWGTVFWSQIYRTFDEIELPNSTVTEANPSHWLDFYRFSSDQVISFHEAQAKIIRAANPGVIITHNVMGQSFDFDHFKLGQLTDVLTWDSYPLGFLAQSRSDDAHKERYLRQGDPDFAGFHHDLYRGCAPFAVIEQQPGPVNWAPYNPIPKDGMVKLWSLETLAHGGEFSSVFRWRQAPFAQEQNHAGLLRPDGEAAAAFAEVHETTKLASDLTGEVATADVALVFDYETRWMSEIQPQGADWFYEDIALTWYAAARSLALDIDIVPPARDLSAYKLVLVPALFHVSAEAMTAFNETEAALIFGPRCGSKDINGSIPASLAPDTLRSLIPLTVNRSETVPAYLGGKVSSSSKGGSWSIWRDEVETDLQPTLKDDEGRAVLFENGRTQMFCALPNEALLRDVIQETAQTMELSPVVLPEGLRVRRDQELLYAFNYAPTEVQLPGALAPKRVHFVHGAKKIPSAGVSIVKLGDDES